MMLQKCVIALCCFLFASFSQYAQQNMYPGQPNYLFFLHNKFTEDEPPGAIHPQYGEAKYSEMVQLFRDEGFKVYSERRPAKTDIHIYARKVGMQIDSLIHEGVPPDHITVVGLSKGGYIAQVVSTLLANPKINYVFIGCYRQQDLEALPDIQFCGNILTIYERSDEFGVSAIERKRTSRLPITRFKEIELRTGKKHGFLFQPLREWTRPVVLWAKRKYRSV